MTSFLSSLVILILLQFSSAFHNYQLSRYACQASTSSVSQLQLFTRWGSDANSDGDNGNTNNNGNNNNNNDDSGDGAVVDQVMQSMQSFKKNQQLGSLTSGLLQDLAGVNVEGRSDDGKVRVVMNGQQYPVGCQVMDDVDMATINSAITQAMQEAHAKSLALMESKMKGLYDDLGLPVISSKK